MSTGTVRGTVVGLGQRANPAFTLAVVLLSVSALGYALTVASLQHHTYVHVMAGVLWTGIDVFMGAVLGPVVGGMGDEEAAALFERLTPKTAFLLPSLAFVTIASGLVLAQKLGVFPHSGPWLALFTAVNVVPIGLLLGYRLRVLDDRRWQVPFGLLAAASLAWVGLTIGSLQMTEPAVVFALGVVTVLSVQGFGFLLPGEIRMYREMRSPDPDSAIISAIGRQNAMLGGIQGIFQLVLILDMVYLRYGGF